MSMRWLMVAAWMSLLFGLSSIPSLKFGFEPLWEQVARKSIHVMVYGVLTVLLWAALRSSGRTVAARLGPCVAIAALFALSDEFHQAFIVGRHGNFVGFLFDLLGILLTAGGLVYNFSGQRFWLNESVQRRCPKDCGPL